MYDLYVRQYLTTAITPAPLGMVTESPVVGTFPVSHLGTVGR